MSYLHAYILYRCGASIRRIAASSPVAIHFAVGKDAGVVGSGLDDGWRARDSMNEKRAIHWIGRGSRR